jgi:hypothetical protein
MEDDRMMRHDQFERFFSLASDPLCKAGSERPVYHRKSCAQNDFRLSLFRRKS